jgi:hypothetical protein
MIGTVEYSLTHSVAMDGLSARAALICATRRHLKSNRVGSCGAALFFSFVEDAIMDLSVGNGKDRFKEVGGGGGGVTAM